MNKKTLKHISSETLLKLIHALEDVINEWPEDLDGVHMFPKDFSSMMLLEARAVDVVTDRMQDLPIGTPVMVKTEEARAWALAYYGGNLKFHSEDNPMDEHWIADYIIPVKDFNFNEPVMSLEHNLLLRFKKKEL